MKIKSINKIQNNSKRYDIETKIHHNFFANGILVHNSLGILFNYNNEWIISTRGSFESEQAIHATEILNTKYKDVIPNLNKELTYLFEIIY